MPKLALLGGSRLIRGTPKARRWPLINGSDSQAIRRVLQRGIISGPYSPAVKALEKRFASYLGIKHCLATNSGTAALHIAVAAAGIKPGDEVLCPAFTFLATALAVLAHNAIPIFVDIDPVTFNIDTTKIAKKITARTKAIIPVHIHGLPADMDEIMRIAHRHRLTVIEDACQAHGAVYRGRMVGTIGAMGAFSLQGSKNLPAGEGGLFVTGEKYFRDGANRARMFGEDIHDDSDMRVDTHRPLEDARQYNATTMGWMYRTTELTAALALSQLGRLSRTTRRAQTNGKYLIGQLTGYPGVTPPSIPKDRTHVFHKFRVRLDPRVMGWDIAPIKLRDIVMKALHAEGVEVSLWQTRPLPGQELFSKREGYGHGCPWSCHGAGKLRYRAKDYPETQRLLDDSFIIGSASYPIFAQPLDLMKQYARAFDKVYSQLGALLK
jgi:perosamine synthetase